MEWINAKEKTPDRKGKIVVKISDKYFFGEAREKRYGFYSSYPEPTIDYELTLWIGSPDNGIGITGNGWIKPSHFAEVDYYCYLPEEKNLT